MIWVAFGGRGTLWGALLGAISINWLRSLLTATYPRLWPIILGGLFVSVILFFPQGLVGLGARLKALGVRKWVSVRAPTQASGPGTRPAQPNLGGGFGRGA
ncbi:MAG: hypothetical protein HY725_08455 [Candidatus Rokubacteria bacterium]|nr:hypothetical protein [Candidatus Rokubacteria bacterium]